ncbi:ferredoxin--NADP reductase [Bacteroidota bacterium]
MEFINAEIVEIKKLTHNTNSFLIRLEDGKHFGYKAGQFVMLKMDVNGEEVKRPYSIASPPPHDMKHAEYIELVIKHVPGGKLTDELFKLKEGAQIQLEGPFGQFILKEPIKEGDIFMATGSGIAPFMGMLRKVFRDHNPKEFYLIFGVRNTDEIIYEDELRQWDEDHEHFHLIICLSQPEKGWRGEVGYVQDILTNYIRDFKDKQAYLCGIPMMMEQSKKRLIELGMKSENIFQEKF